MSEIQLHQWISEEQISLKAERNTKGWNLELGVKASSVDRAMELLRDARARLEAEFPKE
jgi:hypothetical protein